MMQSATGMQPDKAPAKTALQVYRRKNRLRRWVTAAAACAAVYGLLATSWGDQAMASMINTFRMQHMAGIDLNTADFDGLAAKLESGALDGKTLSLDNFGTVTQQGGGYTREITLGEAQKLMGGGIVTASGSTDPAQQVNYSPEMTVTLKLNVPAVNRMIKLLGGDALLPAGADGKAITLHIPANVRSSQSSQDQQSWIHLAQAGMPELTVEDGVDPEAIRSAVLALPLLPQSVRSQLAAIDDWQHTLPMPNIDGVSRSLSLDGHDAIIAEEHGQRYLMWLDNGRITLLSGNAAAFKTEQDIIDKGKELLHR